MMDLSDGLSRDLPRLLGASGVGARVVAADVPVHADAVAASEQDGRSPLEHALDDGEDFELLVAHPALSADLRAALAADGLRLHQVGWVVPAVEGLRLALEGGDVPLVARGYDHFRRGPGGTIGR
jgi:thiamine-monophosphate kinase